jgi:hypothetical protein
MLRKWVRQRQRSLSQVSAGRYGEQYRSFTQHDRERSANLSEEVESAEKNLPVGVGKRKSLFPQCGSGINTTMATIRSAQELELTKVSEPDISILR